MATKVKYLFVLNLGFLGFISFLSLFENSEGKENFLKNTESNNNFTFSESHLVDTHKITSSRKLENNKAAFLTLQIFSDKQYDYDQNIYLAEGNVKAIVNGGTLRSDLLSYDIRSGILSAKGNVRFRKGGQYFRAKEFKFNLIKEEGKIIDSYGILNLKNVLSDLKINNNFNKIKSKNRADNTKTNTYEDGIEFVFGNIKFPGNQITRSNKSKDSINNWRFKSNLITIEENGWKTNKIIFTNDPFDPHQISFEGIDVIAEEKDDGKLLITSSKTNLLLENRTKIFLGKRIFGGKKKKKNKIEFIYDGKDRDGLVLIRRSDTAKIKNLRIDFQPQFLINRAILGKTYNYKYSKNQDINFSDLFGLNIELKASDKNWRFASVNEFSTLNTSKIFNGLRHSNSFKRYFKMPILKDSSFNIFTSYRFRAWNGTIGETEIKSAYGGFIEKLHDFKNGEVKNKLSIRIGAAKYEAEKLENIERTDLWRSSIFAALESEYPIWKIDPNNIDIGKVSHLSPVAIKPEFLLRTNISSAYFNYLNSVDQGFLKLSIGPELRLGTLNKDFFDYTKISVMPGVKIKFGKSPFKFDNAIDLKTIKISLIQQIYGPLMIDVISNLNIDKTSKNYGEYYDTKLGILWHKRSYECGIYYHPNNDAGGVYFRINGFKFGNSVKAVF